MYWSIAIVIIFAIVLALAYTFYLLFYRKEHLQTWITSFITTLVSVLLGVVTAVCLFAYQDFKTTESKRAQMLALVSIELANNAEALKHEGYTIKIFNTTWRFHSASLDHQAIDAAALSGIFNDKQARDLLVLSSNIRFYNSLIDSIDRLCTITPMDYRQGMAKNLYENQGKAHAAMLPNILRCWQDLGLQKTK